MKRVITILLTCFLCINVFSLAEGIDLSNMTLAELEDLEKRIESEIETNHEASSDQKEKVDKAVMGFVEEYYGEDNVDWAWFDYTYTKDWDFYTLTTNADIKKEDGGTAEYDVYGEAFCVESVYQVVYIKIGNEVLYDARVSIITDARVLNMLGVDSNGAVEVQDVDGANEVIVIAQLGDNNEEVKNVQEMLIRLGYLNGSADGDFGNKTKEAVMTYQTDKGFEADGIVTQQLYDILKADYAAAPEPIKEYTASELYNKYEANEIAADAELKNKEIRVAGKVSSISENIWGTPCVSLYADSYGFYTIDCYFDDDQIDQLATLKVNDKITIQGTCVGMDIIYVSLEDCTIVSK